MHGCNEVMLGSMELRKAPFLYVRNTVTLPIICHAGGSRSLSAEVNENINLGYSQDQCYS